MVKWYVYIILSDDDLLYTGITTDVVRRWHEHSNTSKGAKFFRARKPKQLVLVWGSEGRSSASKTEYMIKKLCRKDKLSLIKKANAQAEKLNQSEQFNQDEQFNQAEQFNQMIKLSR